MREKLPSRKDARFTYFEKVLLLDPIFSTYIGRKDRDGELEDTFSESSVEKARKLIRDAMETCVQDWEDQVFLSHLESEDFFSREDVRGKGMIDPSFHFLSFLGEVLFEVQPIGSEVEKENLEARLRNISKVLDPYFSALEASILNEATRPTGWVMKRFVSSLNSCVSSLSDLEERERLRDIDRELLSSYKEKCKGGVERVRILGKREDLDFGDERRLPFGVYEEFAREQCTLPSLDVRLLHEWGKGEVKRIQGEIEKEARKEEVQGKEDELFESEEEVLSAYEEAVRRAEREVESLGWGIRPRQECKVLPVPFHMREYSPCAYYEESEPLAKKEGTFFVNPSPSLHKRRGVEALSFHEAVPGHHFQIQIEIENGREEYRRLCHHTAFVEGWALFSEGVIPSPHRKGVLESELLRACRVVADTGINAFGWGIEETVKYVREVALCEEAEVEVQRYLCDPGQALSYSVGKAVFSTLPSDTKEWVSKVLKRGSCPLWMICREGKRGIGKDSKNFFLKLFDLLFGKGVDERHLPFLVEKCSTAQKWTA